MSTQHTPEPQGYDGRTEYEKKLLGIIENLEQQRDELRVKLDRVIAAAEAAVSSLPYYNDEMDALASTVKHVKSREIDL